MTISNFYLSNFPGMPSVGLSSVQRGKMLMDIDIFPILRSMENKGKILMFCEKKYPVENDFKGDGYNQLSLDIQLAAKSIDCCSYVKKRVNSYKNTKRSYWNCSINESYKDKKKKGAPLECGKKRRVTRTSKPRDDSCRCQVSFVINKMDGFDFFYMVCNPKLTFNHSFHSKVKVGDLPLLKKDLSHNLTDQYKK